MELNGIINVYKEKGVSSFKVVHTIRKILHADKVGHTGTLDPLATGVLPICVGKATRASSYIMDGQKTYIAKLEFGFETDTLDLEGERIKECETISYERKEIEEAISKFIGKTLQEPPIFSAIKVNGKRLYQYARKKQEIEITKREVTINKITILDYKNNILEIEVNCEKGTYIRSLCRDIAYELNNCATMIELCRIKTGQFTAEKAYTIDDIEKAVANGTIEQYFSKVDQYINLEEIILDDETYRNYMLGIKMKLNKKSGEYLVKDKNYDTIGIGLVNSEGELKSKKRLI